MDKTSQTAELGIEAVAQRSGLSQHLIRIWERRYGAVLPARTKSNRRLYSEADAVRLELLNRAVHAGHRISDVAAMPTAKLEQLVGKAPAGRIVNPKRRTNAGQEYVDRALEAIRAFDTESLEAVLSRADVELGQTLALEQVILPLMEQIGRMWKDGDVRIAHEHLATAAIRNHVGGLLGSMRYPATAPGIVVATPVGQLHEVGALVVAVAAAAEGWRPIYLGSDLPADEIAGAASKSGARAIALSLVFPSDDPKIPAELDRLSRLSPEGITLFIGGRSAGAYRGAIESSGATIIGDLADFRRQLETLRGAVS